MNLARIGNKYLGRHRTLEACQTDMPRVATILNISLQLVANLAIASKPFLPFGSEKLRKMLRTMDSFDWAELDHARPAPADTSWQLPNCCSRRLRMMLSRHGVDKLLATEKANEAATPTEPILVKPVISHSGLRETGYPA
ncbi:MAG: hypothetical protein ACLUHA_07665 [Bacteroides stercoris]